MFIQVTNIIVVVVLPVIIIHLKGHLFSLSKLNSYMYIHTYVINLTKFLVGASTVCFFYSILFLKLWSYVQVNMWCRQTYHTKHYNPRKRRPSITLAQLSKCFFKFSLFILYITILKTFFAENGQLDEVDEKDEYVPILVQYPENLCYKDLFYFLCAPTLCYELNFPRTTRIRKRFLLKRVLEVVIGVNVVMALFQQWIIPSVRNSLIPFSNMDVCLATERLLKLAVHLMIKDFCL